MFNRTKKGLVGLDIGSSSIKAVELDGKRGSLSLVSLGFENLPPDSIVDGQIMELNSVSTIVQNLFKENQLKTEKVAAGVSGHSVIIKNIVVPPMTKEELDESIDWHAEEHIPFDISDVNLDYEITASTTDALHVLMAACKKEKVNNLKQVLQLAGKQPSVIDVDTFALQNCYEMNYQPRQGQVVALLNIGASTMNINIVNGVKSVFTRDVTVGGNQFTAFLQRELGLNFNQAEAVKRGMPLPAEIEQQSIEPIMAKVTEMLALEIQKTLDFYRATAEDSSSMVQKMYISGGGSKLPNLASYLSSRFEMPVELLDPFRQIKVDTRKFDPDYMREVTPEMAVAVGLAMRGVEG
jgi:type IV pilus assembly protein PilM